MTGILDAHQKDNCSREYMYITCILAVNIFHMSVPRKLHDPGNTFWDRFIESSNRIQISYQKENEETNYFLMERLSQ